MPRPEPGSAAAPPVAALAALIEQLPAALRSQALTHSSWTEERVDSFERLAFLGDSVLGLAVAASLFERFPELDSGGLTKVHNQAVSGVSCSSVGAALGVPEMLREAEPVATAAAIPAEVLLGGERPLPEATEALIGACFLSLWLRAHGGGRRAGLRAADRPRRGDQDRLQVGPAGAARAPRRARKL